MERRRCLLIRCSHGETAVAGQDAVQKLWTQNVAEVVRNKGWAPVSFIESGLGDVPEVAGKCSGAQRGSWFRPYSLAGRKPKDFSASVVLRCWRILDSLLPQLEGNEDSELLPATSLASDPLVSSRAWPCMCVCPCTQVHVWMCARKHTFFPWTQVSVCMCTLTLPQSFFIFQLYAILY